jgi:hypothetical protein
MSSQDHNPCPMNSHGLKTAHGICRKTAKTGNFQKLERFFKKHPTDISIIDDYGNTPLLMTLRLGEQPHTISVVSYLINLGADPLQYNQHGYNSIMCALIYDCYNAVNWFITHNYTYHENIKQYSSLEMAALRSARSLPLLLQHRTWSQDELDRTLDIVFRTGPKYGIKNITHLLEYGASREVIIKEAYIDAIVRRYDTEFGQEMISILRDINFDFNTVWHENSCFLLFYSRYQRSPTILELIAEFNIAIHVQDRLGNTPLYYFINRECYDIAFELIKKDPRFILNKENLSPFGNLLYRLIICHHDVKNMIIYCLEHGADIEEANRIIDNTREYKGSHEIRTYIDTHKF